MIRGACRSAGRAQAASRRMRMLVAARATMALQGAITPRSAHTGDARGREPQARRCAQRCHWHALQDKLQQDTSRFQPQCFLPSSLQLPYPGYPRLYQLPPHRAVQKAPGWYPSQTG